MCSTHTDHVHETFLDVTLRELPLLNAQRIRVVLQIDRIVSREKEIVSNL